MNMLCLKDVGYFLSSNVFCLVSGKVEDSMPAIRAVVPHIVVGMYQANFP